MLSMAPLFSFWHVRTVAIDIRIILCYSIWEEVTCVDFIKQDLKKIER
jgi:hypothetical protein